jgi:peptidoglycan/xylan/chitin deacetylase (PgdA/CDA1 family)
VTTLARRLSSSGVILCYHNVVPGTDAAPRDTLGLHMPLSTFERQMRWLAHTYEMVPLDELVGRWSRGGSLRGVAAVTFDDGYGGVFDYAWPLLRDLRIPATVFVVAEAPGGHEGFWWDDPDVLSAYSPARRERWLTALHGDRASIVESVAPVHPAAPAPPQVPPWCRPAAWSTIAAAAQSGLQLGVHSATHRSLPTLGDVDLRREVVASRDIVTKRTGVTPDFFAYPYGLWNDRVRHAVRSAGYRAAFTLEFGPHAATADPWALPRINVPAGIGDAAFEAWTAGLSLRRRGGS